MLYFHLHLFQNPYNLYWFYIWSIGYSRHTVEFTCIHPFCKIPLNGFMVSSLYFLREDMILFLFWICWCLLSVLTIDLPWKMFHALMKECDCLNCSLNPFEFSIFPFLSFTDFFLEGREMRRFTAQILLYCFIAQIPISWACTEWKPGAGTHSRSLIWVTLSQLHRESCAAFHIVH